MDNEQYWIDQAKIHGSLERIPPEHRTDAVCLVVLSMTYDNGYAKGYKEGYDQGYEDCSDEDIDTANAFDEGYDQGYKDGVKHENRTNQ